MRGAEGKEFRSEPEIVMDSAPKKVYDFSGQTCISVNEGIAQAEPGVKLNLMGRAIEREAHNNGFATIRNLTGDGWTLTT